MARCVLAVDVGGTKLAAARVDESGAVLGRRVLATRSGTDGEALFGDLAQLVQSVAGEGPIEACGIGSGGPMSPGGELISPLNIHAWRDFPLRARLADLLGVPTFLDNDGKALALGEGWVGAARGQRNFLAMVVSTGVGGGIVVDGRLLDGDTGNAGHIGHVIAVPDGHECGCGARGCLEAEISGSAIARATGLPPSAAPLELRQRAGRVLGRVVGSIANLLDLPRTYVAGSVALGFGEPFFTAAQEEMNRVCRIGHARGSTIMPAGLEADGPLVGAAAVGWRGLGKRILVGEDG